MNQEEQATNSAELELKRCISRLSYVGMGLSKELDQALESLRKLIKENVDEKVIQQSVDQVSKLLISLEDEVETKKVVESFQEVDFINLLLQQKIPQRLKSELIIQQKSYDQKRADQIVIAIAIAIDKFVKELLEVDYFPTKELTKTAETNKVIVKERKGFFVRLFSGFFRKNQQVTTEYNESTESSFCPKELKLSLFQITDQLASVDSYKSLAIKLNNQVNQLNSFDELKDILELITESFINISGKEHKQFERFLASLSKRIDKVNDFINSTVVYSQKVKNESIDLDNDVHSSVSSIKSNLEKSSSLSEVKDLLYNKLDAIINKVNRFKENQENNQHQLNNNLDELKKQLQETEDETSRLKEELEAQKIRAQTDSLTQLPNRYSYNERLTQEYNRWRRYRSPLSLVMGDIDYFKKFNDDYGHDVGDKVLKRIAQFLQSELRESDFVARYGGEEFIILLPETNLIDATKAINKLRLGIKEIDIEVNHEHINIAMSFGVAEFENHDTPNTVFKRADQAIYRAKEKGRDQVCCQKSEPAN